MSNGDGQRPAHAAHRVSLSSCSPRVLDTLANPLLNFRLDPQRSRAFLDVLREGRIGLLVAIHARARKPGLVHHFFDAKAALDGGRLGHASSIASRSISSTLSRRLR